jgi:NTP pyrophosphatase (non-canonical NTP hydrolase)
MKDNITTLIRGWAVDRNLHDANPDRQMLKLMEEVGELANALARNDREKQIDSIGDIYVVLTILSMQLDLAIEDCIEAAYNQIKDRKGYLVNGVFIKEEDIKGE